MNYKTNPQYIFFQTIINLLSINSRLGMHLNDLENINFFTLDITILDNDYQYFEIEGSDKLLVVKSRKHIENEIK